MVITVQKCNDKLFRKYYCLLGKSKGGESAQKSKKKTKGKGDQKSEKKTKKKKSEEVVDDDDDDDEDDEDKEEEEAEESEEEVEEESEEEEVCILFTKADLITLILKGCYLKDCFSLIFRYQTSCIIDDYGK